MSIFKWPFKRKVYAGIDNPRFVDDIKAANEAVIDALATITGLGPNDFAILSGLNYVLGTQNTYTAGVFYFKGGIYYMPNSFNEGLYLTPVLTDTEPQPFDDGNTRNIYTLLQANSTSLPSSSTTPVFSGDMNAYRIDLNTLATVANASAAVIATLGNAAFATIGNLSTEVMPGDYAYSKSQTDAAYVTKTNGMQLTNASTAQQSFTPTNTYDPANKSYVDAAVGRKIIFYKNIHIGDLNTTPADSDTNLLSGSSNNLSIYRHNYPTGSNITGTCFIIPIVNNPNYQSSTDFNNNFDVTISMGKIDSTGFYFALQTSGGGSNTQDIYITYFVVKVS